MDKLRLGKFYIQRHTILENPELVKAITNGMIIYRAEMLLHMDAIEYYAVSDLFEEIVQGEEPNFYDIEIAINEDGTETYKIKASRKIL